MKTFMRGEWLVFLYKVNETSAKYKPKLKNHFFLFCVDFSSQMFRMSCFLPKLFKMQSWVIKLTFDYLIYRLLKVQRMIAHSCESLEYYMSEKFVFKSDVYKTTYSKLNEIDRDIFYDNSTVKLHSIWFYCTIRCELVGHLMYFSIHRWILTNFAMKARKGRKCIWSKRRWRICRRQELFSGVYGF